MEELARTTKQLGNVLKQRRTTLGLTQQALASRIGVRQSTVSELETSSTNAKIGTLLAVLNALDLEILLRIRTRSSKQDLERLF